MLPECVAHGGSPAFVVNGGGDKRRSGFCNAMHPDDLPQPAAMIASAGLNQRRRPSSGSTTGVQQADFTTNAGEPPWRVGYPPGLLQQSVRDPVAGSDAAKE